MGRGCSRIGRETVRDPSALEQHQLHPPTPARPRANTSGSSSAVGGGVVARRPSGINVAPGHTVIAGALEKPSNICRFYVEIFGMKCRGLRVYPEDTQVHLTLIWDEDHFIAETAAAQAPNPQWGDKFEFGWNAESAEFLQNHSFIIQVFESREVMKSSKSLMIGQTEVDLLTIGSGPVHHDLPLFEIDASPSDLLNQKGRVIFDVRMYQICQLIINPIEIIVQLYDDPHENGTRSDSLVAAGMTSSSPIRQVVDEEDEEEEVARVESQETSEEGVAIIARWLVTLTPTGVESAAEYESHWTEECDVPYWNALDPQKVRRHYLFHGSKSLLHPIPSSDDIADPRPHSTTGSMPQRWHTSTSLDKAAALTADVVDEEADEHIQRIDAIVAATSRPALKSFLEMKGRADLQGGAEDETTKAMTYYYTLAQMCQNGQLVTDMLHDELPTIQLETASDHLRQHHLQIRLYATRGLLHPRLYGESWIPFFKIYDADVVEDSQKHFYDATFNEKLWFEGKKIGGVKGLIVFQNNPIIRQMHAGVHTEDGFLRASPPIVGSEHKFVNFDFSNQAVIPPEVRAIIKLHKLLLDMLYLKSLHSQKEKFAAPKTNRGGTNPPNAADIKKVCDSLVHNLKISHAERRRTFIYESLGALVSAQRVFLNLANHTIEFMDYINDRPLYSSILEQILRRGELDLSLCVPSPPPWLQTFALPERHLLYHQLKAHEVSNGVKKQRSPQDVVRTSSQLSFSSEKSGLCALLDGIDIADDELRRKAETLSVEEQREVAIYHKRMKLCRQYYLILNRILNKCLNILCSSVGAEEERPYVSSFLAVSYFRVPSFRHQLLMCVLSPEERGAELLEWRGTDFRLDAETLAISETWAANSDARDILDWSPFHLNLVGYFGDEGLRQSLKPYGASPAGWAEKLARRTAPFFCFLEHWAKHVFQTCIRRPELLTALKWELVPGYATLLKALLLEMKNRDITRYPDSLLNCSAAMLGNERLLSVFIKITFLKTCVHRTHSVFSTLNYLDYWIQVMTLRKQNLPATFDFRFFLHGLDLLFNSELCLCVAKGSWFVYKNVPFFQGGNLQAVFVDLLMNRHFYHLFLSWSWLVRRCFMWLLLFRVCESARKILGRLTSTSQPSLNPVCSVTRDETTMLMAYVELSRRLEILKASQPFPKGSVSWKLEVMCGPPTVNLLPSLKEAGGGLEAQQNWKWDSLPPPPPPPPDAYPYIKAAVPEFCKEMAGYRDWVLNGATPLPTICIPSSPLDSNVDVPLDEW